MLMTSPHAFIINHIRSFFKSLRKGLAVIALLLLTVIGASHIAVEWASRGKTFNHTQEVRKNKVGLLLGTSKYIKGGRINQFFVNRIEAAVRLYEADKIDYILVSGDNRHASYNEPDVFRKALIERGIPDDCIFLDFAGFRTLDSVVRALEVFGQSEFTVISQQFHNERAIFIARGYGIDAIGYNAGDVPGYHGLKVKAREALARVKVVLDLIFKVQPHFLGEPIEIVHSPSSGRWVRHG